MKREKKRPSSHSLNEVMLINAGFKSKAAAWILINRKFLDEN